MGADAYMPVSLPAAGALHLPNFDQLRDALLAQGLATAEEITATAPPSIAAPGSLPRP